MDEMLTNIETSGSDKVLIPLPVTADN